MRTTWMEATDFADSSTVGKLIKVTEDLVSTPARTAPATHDSRHAKEMDTGHEVTKPRLPPSASRHTQCGPTAGRSAPRANSNAARERSRVRTLRTAFLELQRSLPAVPKDTKLSKLDVLVLATTYIAHLTSTLAKSSGHFSERDRHPRHDTPVFPKGQSQSSASRDDTGSSVRQCRTADTATTHPTPYRRRGGRSRQGGGIKKEPSEIDSGRGLNGDNHGVAGLRSRGYLHPVKKWPMRTRLYAGIMASAYGARRTTSDYSNN